MKLLKNIIEICKRRTSLQKIAIISSIIVAIVGICLLTPVIGWVTVMQSVAFAIIWDAISNASKDLEEINQKEKAEKAIKEKQKI